MLRSLPFWLSRSCERTLGVALPFDVGMLAATMALEA
jgi:hypothetical protein